MNKKKIALVAIPVALCAGCVILGQDTSDPETQKKGVEGGTAILNAVAGVTGQAWAVPIISMVGSVVLGALNAHHGVRKVAVGTATTTVDFAKIIAGFFRKDEEPKV